jgi:hypothetical protein
MEGRKWLEGDQQSREEQHEKKTTFRRHFLQQKTEM